MQPPTAAPRKGERLGHFDLLADLVMAMICSLGPILLTLRLLPDHPGTAILASGCCTRRTPRERPMHDQLVRCARTRIRCPPV